MRTAPPSSLQSFIGHLEESGFSKTDLFPEGAPMGTERVLLSKDSLIFIIGSDRGFWYVAAGPDVDKPANDTLNPMGYGVNMWEIMLRGQDKFEPEDEYPFDEEAIERYLEDHCGRFLSILDDMLIACSESSIDSTWDRLWSMNRKATHFQPKKSSNF